MPNLPNIDCIVGYSADGGKLYMRGKPAMRVRLSASMPPALSRRCVACYKVLGGLAAWIRRR